MKLTFDQTRSSAIAAIELQETASTLVVSYHSAPSKGYVFGILDLPKVLGALKRFSTDSQVSIGSTVAALRADCSLLPLADPTDLRRQQCIEPTFGECLKQWQHGTMSLTGREAATLSNLVAFLPKTTVAALRGDCSLMPLADPEDLRNQLVIEPTFGACLNQWQSGSMTLTGREAATLSNLVAFLPKTTVAARAREALVATAAKAGGRGQAARQASSKRLFYWAQGHKTPKP